MTISPNDLVNLARVGGIGLALALLLVLVALWRQMLWIGPTVLLLLAEKDKQILERDRRIDALTDQVEERQRLLDRTLDVATVLKSSIERARER